MLQINLLRSLLTPIFTVMNDAATTSIWNSIIAKPKWYAGIRNLQGGFYSAQSANHLKKSFEAGTLSLDIIQTVFEAHGYTLIQQWVRKSNWG